jgi:GNAT superfamily N-acetyltransferase
MRGASGPARNPSVTSSHGTEIDLGPLRPEEHDLLFGLFGTIVERGDGFPHAAPLSREIFNDLWAGPAVAVVAARVEGELAGAYYLKPNFPGRAAHIANAGYVVSETYRGRGVGRAMVEDSITRAPLLGYDAIQFNLVFASNPARALYEELGWREIGRVPRAVGGDDGVIYWRRVGE